MIQIVKCTEKYLSSPTGSYKTVSSMAEVDLSVTQCTLKKRPAGIVYKPLTVSYRDKELNLTIDSLDFTYIKPWDDQSITLQSYSKSGFNVVHKCRETKIPYGQLKKISLDKYRYTKLLLHTQEALFLEDALEIHENKADYKVYIEVKILDFSNTADCTTNEAYDKCIEESRALSLGCFPPKSRYNCENLDFFH